MAKDDDFEEIRSDIEDVKRARREFGGIFREEKEGMDEDIDIEKLAGVVDELYDDTDDIQSLLLKMRDSVSQLRDRVSKIETRLSKFEKKQQKASSSSFDFDTALDKYENFKEKGKELAEEMRGQRKKDGFDYKEIITVVQETKNMNIRYGVKGRKKGEWKWPYNYIYYFSEPTPTTFKDTEILQVPDKIKRALNE